MSKQAVLMGNEAIARALLEAGAQVLTAYPGTPSSEIVEAAARWKREERLDHVHVEWSVNEKVAFEVAYAAAVAGKRAAVAMKQVGLNVASDPFLSAAYMGVTGGLLLIAADDPGPHSSQTEQDSRAFAAFARVPALDPASPREAASLVAAGFELSERLRVPVLLRPTTRVCHARSLVPLGALPSPTDLRRARFERDPARWTATPRLRYLLHLELEEKIEQLRTTEAARPRLTAGSGRAPAAVLASGIPWAHLTDLFEEQPALAAALALYKLELVYPVDGRALAGLLDRHGRVLVLEESDPVIEGQFPSREHVRGRLDGFVPRAGELTPEVVAALAGTFAGEPVEVPSAPQAPGRRPSLCAGCGHRSAFYALRRAFPKGILTGDIGCYTLGMNLGAVDAFICMGGSIALAAGTWEAYRADGLAADAIPPIAATIGDSTFFHSGMAPLLNAVHQGARVVVVVLDNATTGMTGQQPTPGTGLRADGSQGPRAEIAAIARAVGCGFVAEADPYDRAATLALLGQAHAHCRSAEGGPAVVILRRPCIQMPAGRGTWEPSAVRVGEACDGCGACVKLFECPAFRLPEGADRMEIDAGACVRCGQCVGVCPKGALEPEEAGA